MSSIALDIRDIPDLTDDLESPGEHAGPDRPERAGNAASGPVAAEPTSRLVSGPTRLRCADCGTVLAADEPADRPDDDDRAHGDVDGYMDGYAGPPPRAGAPLAWRVPVHAVGPAATEPFEARLCPGSDRCADPEADAVPEPEPDLPTPPALTLPRGLDWRTQPFSHASV
ncbi:hypothetical protein [Streptodolium elevatio]|uniref:Uncharacterized protein n=1 Tax=Streptodolium elevatio TaxID=3157996 RepID=A0ABV3DLV6_9ACTN